MQVVELIILHTVTCLKKFLSHPSLHLSAAWRSFSIRVWPSAYFSHVCRSAYLELRRIGTIRHHYFTTDATKAPICTFVLSGNSFGVNIGISLKVSLADSVFWRTLYNIVSWGCTWCCCRKCVSLVHLYKHLDVKACLHALFIIHLFVTAFRASAWQKNCQHDYKRDVWKDNAYRPC